MSADQTIDEECLPVSAMPADFIEPAAGDVTSHALLRERDRASQLDTSLGLAMLWAGPVSAFVLALVWARAA